jgi:hypothetical protein
MAFGILAEGTWRELGDAAEGDMVFRKQIGEGFVPHRMPLLSMIGVDFGPDINRMSVTYRCLCDNRFQRERPIEAGSEQPAWGPTGSGFPTVKHIVRQEKSSSSKTQHRASVWSHDGLFR